MSAGYPDGCTQADHDAYYDREVAPEPDEDTILADCGHWESESRCEPVGGKLICGKCFDAEVERVRLAIRPDLFEGEFEEARRRAGRLSQ